MLSRQNLTMRVSMRRLARLTNGFSKKVENHAAMVALHFMHYKLVDSENVARNAADAGGARGSGMDVGRHRELSDFKLRHHRPLVSCEDHRMGDLDSSLTRGQPVLNVLLDRWPDGEARLGELWDRKLPRSRLTVEGTAPTSTAAQNRMRAPNRSGNDQRELWLLISRRPSSTSQSTSDRPPR
jgi:hypothetical protein